MVGTVVVVGGAGFVGRAAVAALVAAGHRVVAPVRSDEAAAVVTGLGAEEVRGDASRPQEWVGHVSGALALLDLTQPPLPKRLTVAAARGIAEQRLVSTQAMIAALRQLPAEDRPLWVSVSGTDDLAPDRQGRLSSTSEVAERLHGFGHIGVPVRRAIAASGLDAMYVHFGQMVYGPGKGFVAAVVAPLEAGKARVVGRGDNRLPLTHVDDAAAALAHVVGLERSAVVGRTVVAVPSTVATQRELFDVTASELGVRKAASAPRPLAAVVAGRALAEVMTLDAVCDPDVLRETGFEFRHETLRSGVAASLRALQG